MVAFQIQGNTFHAALGIAREGKLEWVPLSADKLNSMRSAFRNIRLVVTDEVSMESKAMDELVCRRLQEIVGRLDPYGGLHLFRLGDIFQLAPVGQRWIFERGKSLHDSLWMLYTKMFELTQVVRQKDHAFAALLNRIREGCIFKSVMAGW